jgi:hypothetical protein
MRLFVRGVIEPNTKSRDIFKMIELHNFSHIILYFCVHNVTVIFPYVNYQKLNILFFVLIRA